MNLILPLLLVIIHIFIGCSSTVPKIKSNSAINQKFYALSANSIEGSNVNFSDFRGKVLIIVNTASKCGFATQFAGLEQIYSRYKDKGLIVLAFPSNDFMDQEPGNNNEIQKFCRFTAGVTFPVFEKTPVKGSKMHPIFSHLTQDSDPKFTGEVEWNFEKFIIDRSGNLRGRFGPFTTPTNTKITALLKTLLSE